MKEKNTNRSVSVLIPDGESHILRYVINCFSQIREIKTYVMSNKKNNAMRYSRYVHKFSYYAKTDSDLDWIANINKEIEKHDIDVVMPIFEVGIRALIKHRDRVLYKDRLGVLPSLSSFDSAINKGLLSRHLDSNNIPNPKSIMVESQKQLDKIDVLNFPVLIKPLEGFGGGYGIHVFKAKQDIYDHFDKHGFNYANLFQEYIDGYDIDCSVLCKEGNILAFTIQKGNMIGKNEFAPQIGVDFLYEPELYRVVESLMKSLNWSGVAHIDMRYDKNDKQFKVIEMNPRFWMSLNASLLAGVNFPHLYCLASMDEKFERPEYEFMKYINLKGLLLMIRREKSVLLKPGFIINNTPLKFVLKDPLPIMYKFISKD